MPTKLMFLQGGSPVPDKTKVVIHWKGFTSGYNTYYTDDGQITVEDATIKGQSRTAEHIYVYAAPRNRSYAIDNQHIRKNILLAFAVDTYRTT